MNYKAQKTFTIFICFCFFITFKSLSFVAPLDSIGVERKGNKILILHEVDPKETLFSISKKYHVKIEVIQTENPEVKSGLKVGQVIKVPFEQKNNTTSAKHNGNKIHTVISGQTLYSISREYNVSVEDIKKWNNLSSNELNVGQEIIVSVPISQVKKTEQLEKSKDEVKASTENKEVPNFKYDSKGNKIHITESGQTLYSLTRIYNISVEDIKKWNNLQSNEISPGQELIVERAKAKETAENKEKETSKEENNNINLTHQNTPKEEPSKPEEHKVEPVKISNSDGFKKIVDRGLAEVIEESEDNPKFLALHKTASVGTIIQVKNELNNLYIFARVIGKLPQTTSNDKLIIKLSKKAYDKLGAVDKRFPVEVSYVPNN